MAGLSLSLVLVAALVAWLLLGRDAYVVAPTDEPSGAAPETVDPSAAGALLERLERSVGRDDPAAAATLAPPRTPSASLLRAVVVNAARLDVEDFSLRYVDEVGAPDADGSWSAAVEVTWRFAGYDAEPASTEVRVDFGDAGGGVRVLDVGGGGGRTPVWLTGPVSVASSPTTLVLSAARRPASAYAAQARQAVTTVSSVLTDWRRRLVVEVPRGERALDDALDTDPGTNQQIAGVTAAVDGRAEGSPVHVFLNPGVYDGLGRQGAQVVMSHEAVHVATRAPSSALPTWLTEGFADYVALRRVPLPFSVTARQVATQVREDGLPSALPDAVAFDTGDAHLGAAYEAAWVACLVVVDRGGQDALVDLYRDVEDGTALGAALRREVDWSEADLVQAWRERLAALAGLSGDDPQGR